MHFKNDNMNQRIGNIFLAVLIVGCICLVSCGTSPESPTRELSVEKTETGIVISDNEEEKGDSWNLLEHLDDETVTILGYQTSNDYPYGYNVGEIEDDVVGNAILITPGTSIIVEDSFEEFFFLNFEYILHPWVAENSDGAILNISIEGNGSTGSYTFDAKDSFQDEALDLQQFTGESVRITFSVQNEPDDNDECDWLVIKNVVIDKDETAVKKVFNENRYVRSATYFSDEWPINFWNSELDNLELDMEQIRADGFDSIILVIPWREFQPGLNPITYNEYAFDNLKRIMQAAEKSDLAVYARIGYTWDFYNDGEENIIDRFCRLLGEEDVQNAWYSYVEKMYETLSMYSCFREAFLTWEDFWNTLGVCDEIFEKARREKAAYIGYQEWVQEHYSLSEYNMAFGANYKSYTAIPVPRRTEPAMAAMYSFYDDFLIDLLADSQHYFPNLSMEVRLDWDMVYTPDDNTDYYKHTKTFECGESYYTATMYGIPMGFENIGERVSYQEAMEKTEYMLKQLKLQNENKPVYIEQFIFADNTPKFVNNAQIKEEDLNTYLENIAPVLLENSEGYGIWTYRNYCANMLYNPQFALKNEGWNTSGEVAFEESCGSMTCVLEQGAAIGQPVGKIRNHFDSEEYLVSFDVTEVEKGGRLSISLGASTQSVRISESGKVCLTFSKPISFNINIASQDCSVRIDNIKLYSQVQQGFLYDEDNNELLCIDGIRTLNDMLSK